MTVVSNEVMALLLASTSSRLLIEEMMVGRVVNRLLEILTILSDSQEESSSGKVSSLLLDRSITVMRGNLTGNFAGSLLRRLEERLTVVIVVEDKSSYMAGEMEAMSHEERSSFPSPFSVASLHRVTTLAQCWAIFRQDYVVLALPVLQFGDILFFSLLSDVLPLHVLCSSLPSAVECRYVCDLIPNK